MSYSILIPIKAQYICVNRGDRGIFGQFLQFQLWQRFFPLIFSHFLFQRLNFIPNSFLFPNLFSNFVLVINSFFYFHFSRSFFFWGVWGISWHIITLVFLICKKAIKFKNLVPFDQDFFLCLNGVIKNTKSVVKVDNIQF